MVSSPLPLRCPRAETPHQPATAIVPHLLKLISNEEEIWGAGEDLEGRRLPRWLASVSSKLNIDYENNKQKLRNFPPGHDNSSRGRRGGSKLGRYNRSIRLPWGKMVEMWVELGALLKCPLIDCQHGVYVIRTFLFFGWAGLIKEC